MKEIMNHPEFGNSKDGDYELMMLMVYISNLDLVISLNLSFLWN